MQVFSFGRRGWQHILLLLIIVCLGAAVPVHASAVRTIPPGTTRFIGQVIDVTTKANHPAAFTLMQGGGQLIAMQVGPSAIFTPLSAEAEVEDFQQSDYALVLARRVNRVWIAYQVDFDVRPIVIRAPVQIVNGSILQVTQKGKRFKLLPDTGKVRWVIVTRKTTFHLQGQLQSGPPVLQKGTVVKVELRYTAQGWSAVDVDVLLSG